MPAGGSDACTGREVLTFEVARRYRSRLLREYGILPDPARHYRRPMERPLRPEETEQVTILFGGLTRRHERLIKAGMEGLGYRVEALPTPTKADCQTGKEYCNPGQCNPSYFTVGSLINYLRRLRDEHGMSVREIVDRYVYITAGSCGPCRFGMYESEYRLALHNAGFEGFRVLVFQQGAGLKQTSEQIGIRFDVPFFLTLLNAMFVGDVLNELAHQIRPYEIEPGTTDRVLEECTEICAQRLRKKCYDIRAGALAKLLSKLAGKYGPEDVAVFLDQLTSDWYTSALRRCADIIQERIEVDYTRPKPVVKIIGEFWAQTTEGDGNFRMFEFLESEGAEVVTEPVANWVAYILHQATQEVRDRRGLPEDMSIRLHEGWLEKLRRYRTYWHKMLIMKLANWMLHREYERLRRAAGGTIPPLVDQKLLRDLAHPYFNTRAAGGEGHLEVAKTIYYSSRKLCHMVLSLKPFGCMPSTQSDGAQAAVTAHYPEVIFLPIETSPEGEVNAYSRVQMALGEAKVRCKAEFERAVKATGFGIDQIRAYVASHRDLRVPLQRVPRQEGIAGRAANFVMYVAEIMRRERELPRAVGKGSETVTFSSAEMAGIGAG